jgi:hypothetical protein
MASVKVCVRSTCNGVNVVCVRSMLSLLFDMHVRSMLRLHPVRVWASHRVCIQCAHGVRVKHSHQFKCGRRVAPSVQVYSTRSLQRCARTHHTDVCTQCVHSARVQHWVVCTKGVHGVCAARATVLAWCA